MKNIKLIENFLILNKKNEFNDSSIDDVKKFLERQIKEIKEWKWNGHYKESIIWWGEDLSEKYPFSIILEKKDNKWNKLEIFAWIDWDDFNLNLYVNKWIPSKFLIFFNAIKKKFSKNLKTVNEVINEIEVFISKNEEIYRDEFNYIK